MSILPYHYKQLTACISEIERIETKVNSKKKDWSFTKKKEEVKQEEKKEMPKSLESHLLTTKFQIKSPFFSLFLIISLIFYRQKDKN
jgi:hypothetical protein